MRPHRETRAIAPDSDQGSGIARRSHASVGRAPPRQPIFGDVEIQPHSTIDGAGGQTFLSVAQAEVLAHLSDRIEALDRRLAEGNAKSVEAAIAAFDKALDDRLSALHREPSPIPPRSHGRHAVPAALAVSLRHEGAVFREDATARADGAGQNRRDPYRRAVPASEPLEPAASSDPASTRRIQGDDGAVALRRDLSAARDFASTVAAQARAVRDPIEMRALASSIALLSTHIDRLAEDQALGRSAVPETARPAASRSMGATPVPASGARSPEAAAESCIGLSAVRNLERQVVRLAEGVGAPRRDPALETIEKSLADLVARVGSLQDALRSSDVQPPEEQAAAAREPEPEAGSAAVRAEIEALKASQDTSDRRIQATLSGMHTVLERLVTRMPAHDGQGIRTEEIGSRRDEEGRRSDIARLLAVLRPADPAYDDDLALAARTRRREAPPEDPGLAALDASLAAIKAAFLANSRRQRGRSFDD